MPGCSAPCCGNNSSYKYEEDEEYADKPTFHHFSKDAEKREKWIQILRDQGKKPRRNSKNTAEETWTPNLANATICSDHFEEKYLIKSTGNSACRSMTTLKEDAIPTIFGAAAIKHRKRIYSGAPKKQKITNDDHEVASTATMSDTNNMSMSEVSIHPDHQMVSGNTVNEEQNTVDMEVMLNVPGNDAALEDQMEQEQVVQDDLVQNIVAFDDIIEINQLHQSDNDVMFTDFFIKGSDGTAQSIESQGKVVTLPIGNNQTLGLSILSKLGGVEVLCVDKNDGPIPTVYFRTMASDGSYAMFRAKVEGTEIPTSGTTNPFIDNDSSDIAIDKISEIEDLVKKFRASTLNQEEQEKLKIVLKALDGDEKKDCIDIMNDC